MKHFWLLLALWAVGCQATVEPTHDPVALAGQVDATLPPEAQAKQAALQRVLQTLQRGVKIEYLAEHLPELQLQESDEAFFAGAVDLYRWDFAGPPQGDKLPLTLVFRLDQPGFPERIDQRTYQVSGSGNRFQIRRVE